MKEQHKNVNSTNNKFNNLMHTYIDLNIEYHALTMIFSPRSIHPSSEQMAPFYKELMEVNNFKNTAILNIPRGYRTLGMHQLFKALHPKVKATANEGGNMLDKMASSIENDTLRGYFVSDKLVNFKSYNKEYLSFSQPYRKDIALSKYVSDKVDAFEITIKTMEKGDQGFDFTYKDINGRDVSFTDFKGKYVYIDAWATWCAPCKQEIPYLKQLEKDLHEKNIVFVSISFDKPKDKEKWKTYVKENELTGVQLITENAFETRIAWDYKINAIPRFLLFDPEGKIIDADAKRPSLPELKKQLLKLLK